MKAHSNYLLTFLAIGLGTYLILDDYIINPIVTCGFAIMGMLLGAAIVIRYWPGFWDVLINGKRSQSAGGAHLAIIGITFIAFSIIYSGLYSLLWSFFGRPETWIGSPSSQIGRVLMIVGCLGIYFAPDITDQQLPKHSFLGLTLIITGAAIVSFMLGAYFGQSMMPRLFAP